MGRLYKDESGQLLEKAKLFHDVYDYMCDWYNISTFRSLSSSETQAIILKPKKILFMYTLYLSINIVHLFWHANKYVANK